MNEDAPLAGLSRSHSLLSPSGGEAVSNLNLGVIGNCSFSALIDERARIVWSCLPRFDGDPVFCSLLNNGGSDEQGGYFDVTIDGQVKSRQYYLDNTAVLVTELEDAGGSVLRITDFAPRFTNMWRVFRPLMIIRHLDPSSANRVSAFACGPCSITEPAPRRSPAVQTTSATSARTKRCG